MSNGTSVVKLLNFFIKFREACNGRNSKHRLIDIIRDVFACDNEDEVFSLYPMLLNQVRFAFIYLAENTYHDDETLKNVKGLLERAINQSRERLYQTLSQCNQDPKQYPIYLEETTFVLFRSLAQGLRIEAEAISHTDIEDLIQNIEELRKSIEIKEMNFGDKLYLQNLLRKIALTLKNYDKLSLSDDLSGDMISLCYNVSLNDELKKDEDLCDKVKNFVSKTLHKIKPHKLQLAFKAQVPMLLEVSGKAEWDNKSVIVAE